MRSVLTRCIVVFEVVGVALLAGALLSSPATAREPECNNKPSGAEMGACQTPGQISVCYSSQSHYCFYNQGGNCYTGDCTSN